jgi:hypothetical protein
MGQASRIADGLAGGLACHQSLIRRNLAQRNKKENSGGNRGPGAGGGQGVG